MNDNIDFEASLVSGSNYEIEDGLVVLNHKLGKIYKEIKLSRYFNSMDVISIDKEDIIEKGYSESETDYYILCKTIDFLEMFIECKEVKYNTRQGEYMVYINDTEFIWVDNIKLNKIFNIVKSMYCIQDTEKKNDEIVFDNDEVAKKFAEFFEAEKNMKSDDEVVVTISSIIEYVSNKHHSINMINIWDLTMWQLQRSYLRLEMIGGYDRTVTGIFSGTISGNSVDINKIRADKIIK